MKYLFKMQGITILAVIVCLSFSSCNEAESNAEPALSFTLIKNGTAYSVSKGTFIAADVVIPATYKELPVIEIADSGFSSYENLKTITIPDGVTRIGNHAFFYNIALTGIVLPAGVANIGDNAFTGCTSLTIVAFKGNITESGFSSANPFPEDLRSKYFAEDGGIGVYSRANGTTDTWTGAPTGVTAITEFFNRIVVSWSSVTGATGYKIYRNTSAADNFIEIGTSVTTSFTDTGLANTNYFYKVAAYYNSGTSPQSNTVNATTMPLPSFEMVLIPSGTFTMGSPEDEPYRKSDETQHQVTINRNFYMGKFQVTQEQYQAVTGVNPSYFTTANGREPSTGETDSKRPVEYVTWYDAIEFCNRLSVGEGLTPVYTITRRFPTSGYPITSATVTVNWDANGYRLPTEAEWEYACRAGTTTAYYTGDTISDNTSWYSPNSGRTHEVGKKPANDYGLHDMHGNVWEWCWDWYGSYASGVQTDPRGAASGDFRVARGGSWFYYAPGLRSADRYYLDPSYRNSLIGFRVVRP